MRLFCLLESNISYYWFNRDELLKKAKKKCHNKGGKERVVKYYQDKKEAIKEKARKKYKELAEK